MIKMNKEGYCSNCETDSSIEPNFYCNTCCCELCKYKKCKCCKKCKDKRYKNCLHFNTHLNKYYLFEEEAIDGKLILLYDRNKSKTLEKSNEKITKCERCHTKKYTDTECKCRFCDVCKKYTTSLRWSLVYNCCYDCYTKNICHCVYTEYGECYKCRYGEFLH